MSNAHIMVSAGVTEKCRITRSSLSLLMTLTALMPPSLEEREGRRLPTPVMGLPMRLPLLETLVLRARADGSSGGRMPLSADLGSGTCAASVCVPTSPLPPDASAGASVWDALSSVCTRADTDSSLLLKRLGWADDRFDEANEDSVPFLDLLIHVRAAPAVTNDDSWLMLPLLVVEYTSDSAVETLKDTSDWSPEDISLLPLCRSLRSWPPYEACDAHDMSEWLLVRLFLLPMRGTDETDGSGTGSEVSDW
mmetsp:Transcript_75523/g.231033  ORF Transcript_75523/g.231033 Transcript_75523/m.231033 type:complete len:251 (+) Transcript_75523:442-1194(+)